VNQNIMYFKENVLKLKKKSQQHCHKPLLIYKDSTYLAPLAQTKDLMIADSHISRSVNQQQTGPKIS